MIIVGLSTHSDLFIFLNALPFISLDSEQNFKKSYDLIKNTFIVSGK